MRKFLNAAVLFAVGCVSLLFTAYPLLRPGTQFADVVRQYSYFTDQIVVLVGIYLILSGLHGFGVKKLAALIYHPYVKAGITAYIITVGITYYVGIVPFAMMGADGLFAGELQSIFMHGFVPLFMLGLYFKTPFVREINLMKSLSLLVYPVVYLVYLCAYTLITGVGIYPFLRLEYVGNFGMMALCLAGVIAGMLSISYLTVRLYNKQFAKGEEKGEAVEKIA